MISRRALLAGASAAAIAPPLSVVRSLQFNVGEAVAAAYNIIGTIKIDGNLIVDGTIGVMPYVRPRDIAAACVREYTALEKAGAFAEPTMIVGEDAS